MVEFLFLYMTVLLECFYFLFLINYFDFYLAYIMQRQVGLPVRGARAKSWHGSEDITVEF